MSAVVVLAHCIADASRAMVAADEWTVSMQCSKL